VVQSLAEEPAEANDQYQELATELGNVATDWASKAAGTAEDAVADEAFLSSAEPARSLCDEVTGSASPTATGSPSPGTTMGSPSPATSPTTS
jgi:hypothetical protein